MLVLKKIPNFRNKVTINYSSNLFSNSIVTSNPVYLPNSTHQTPSSSSTPTYYLIELKEEVTGKVYNTLLPKAKQSSNARYITFDLYVDLNQGQSSTRTGVIGLQNAGKYTYEVFGVIENLTNPADDSTKTNENARVLIDTGLAMVYDSFDFTNTYYKPDRQEIPSVISYKNE